jgi:hypothetical protein
MPAKGKGKLEIMAVYFFLFTDARRGSVAVVPLLASWALND